MTELKPCPFCGSKNVDVTKIGPEDWWLQCRGCGATGPIGESEEETIKLWNRCPRKKKKKKKC